MNAAKILVGLALAIATLNALGHEQGTWFVRGAITTVAPDASSSPLNLDGALIADSSADVDDNTQLGLTVGYMLTDRWAVELLASTPYSHDIEAATGALGLGTVEAGETKHLPPTLSLHYFLAAPDAKWQPCVGAGLNYTLFFDDDVAG